MCEGETQSCGTGRWIGAILWAIILAGVALRLAWPGTMTFADDQARACALAQDIAEGRWESAGLLNSGAFRNPPGFVYLLAGVWILCPHPIALIVFVQLANVAAFVAAGWMLHRIAGRPAALWGMAYFAAAPWAIQYCRWIWAQDMLFPPAVFVYIGLWRWMVVGRRWGALMAILALLALVEIHLTGVVLALAVALMVALWRPKIPWLPVAMGLAIVATALVPYWLSGELRTPAGNRIGITHVWRVIPAAAMSVGGLGWQLEFKAGYVQFVESLAWRHWPYLLAMAVPAFLLVIGLSLIWRNRWSNTHRPILPALRPRTGIGLCTALLVLIPLSFIILRIRTSPTYLPLWYPLPFLPIGLAAAWLASRRGTVGVMSKGVMLACLVGELSFFAEQLCYLDKHGGVPKSLLDRSYNGLMADGRVLVASIHADEIWVQYTGSSVAMDEAVAYAFRRLAWTDGRGQRALIRYCGPWDGRITVEWVPPGVPVPANAWQAHPWSGPAQHQGRILQIPASREVSDRKQQVNLPGDLIELIGRADRMEPGANPPQAVSWLD